MPLTPDDFHPVLDRRQTGELTRLIGELDHFRGHWRKLQEIRAERLAQLRQVTTIESTASSTRIEGAELSDAEVARVLEGLHVDSFRARDEEEVRGYGELLTRIYEDYHEIGLTENHLRQLHQILLRHSSKDERHRGEYKKFPNQVVKKDGDRVLEVVFRTADPFETPARMAELVEVTNRAWDDPSLHRLVVVARFIVDFLAVHPFQDGNGRLARAVTTLLLLRAGYDYVPYASLERIIEENKQGYYASLRDSQLAMREDPAAFSAWLLFFLRALRVQQTTLQAKLQVERTMLDLSDLQRQIVELVARQGRVTAVAVATALGMSARSARHHLGILAQRGAVAARGEARGRFYAPADADQQTDSPLARQRGTNAIIAEVYERGGRIAKNELVALVRKHGYDARTVGALHSRRSAHLRRDPDNGESVLTSRGEEVARQYLFAARLAQRPTRSEGVE